MRSLWGLSVGGSLLLLCLSLPSLGQTITGTISGDVTDSTGAVVPNVSVVAESKATGLSRSATSSSTGAYRIIELPIGTYKVDVTAPGFKTLVSTADVSAGGVTHADFKLVVGQRTETVEVESTAPLVEFSDKLNSYVDEDRIKEMPLNGRDFNSLLALTPGVQRTPGGGFLAITINGTRATSNNYMVDGISNNDRFYGDSALNETGVLGIPATLIPPDAIQELDMQQSPSAEFGVKGGAAINLIMKSGTNAFHGSAYGFRHTSFADAANYFVKHGGCTSGCTTPLRNMQFGGTFGGPIIKDKTFFFVYYEGQRYASISPFQAGIPTQGEVDAAHAAIAAAGLTENPVGQTLLSFYPIAPVSDVNNGLFLTTVRNPNVANGDSFSVKIDQRIGAKHQVSGRYFFGDSVQNVTAFSGELSPPPPNKSNLFNSVAPSRAQLLGGTWTWNIDNTKILESRFGITRFSQIIDVNNKINPKDLGLDTGPLDPVDYGWPGLYYFSNFGYTGGVIGYPLSTRPTQNYDWSEHFSWNKGNHSMKMGGNYQYAFTDTLRNRSRSNLAVFNSTDHVAAIEQVLLGKLDSAGRSFGNTQRHIFQKTLGVYFMDDWKVRPRLTLSYGLRYDISSAIGESHNLGSNFFPDRGVVDLGKGLNRLYATPRNNFGPRVGFAWDIFGNSKTALRGGYALTYDFPNFAAISAPQGNFSPFNVTTGAFTQTDQGIFAVSLNGTGSGVTDPLAGTCVDPNNPPAGGDWVCITPGVSIYGSNPTGTPPFAVVSIVSPLKTPMYHLFNLSLSRELFAKNAVTVAYVGQRGHNLLLNRDLNATPIGCNVPPSAGCIPPFASQYPNISHILQITNDAKSWYDSMEITYRQQDWHGINTQYNLTWSKCFDYESANRNGRFTFVQSQNPYRPALDKGFCDHDVPLNFNIGGNYTVPKVSQLGRYAGAGWEISTVFTAISGRPFNPNLRSTDPSGQGVGSARPNYDGSKIHYHPRNPDSYVDETFTDNTTADPCGRTGAGLPITPFYIPCDGTIGNARRNMLRGPGLIQLDGVLVKNTKITDRVNLQFRWEVYNVLNRANFATTGTAALGNVTSSTFGVISSTPDVDAGNPVVAQGGPRNMVFALKLSF